MTSEPVEVEIPFHRLTGRQTNIFNLICCKKQNKKVMVEILKKKKKHTQILNRNYNSRLQRKKGRGRNSKKYKDKTNKLSGAEGEKETPKCI